MQFSSNPFYAAYINDKVAVKLGNSHWIPEGSDWILNVKGETYAVWSKIKLSTFP